MIVLLVVALFIGLLWFYFDPFLTQLNKEIALLTSWFARRYTSVTLSMSSEELSTETGLFTRLISIIALVLNRIQIQDWLSKLVGWLWKLISKLAMGGLKTFDVHNYLFTASKNVYAIFAKNEDRLNTPAPKFYIFGHDHHPDSRIIPAEWDEPFYLNTGAWLPDFDEETRRLRTGGKDVELTFLEIWEDGDEYVHSLRQWNDNAQRADLQIVPSDKKKDPPTHTVLTILIGLVIGAFVGVWLQQLIVSLLAFSVLGYFIGLFWNLVEANN